MKRNQNGFGYIEFVDRYGNKCSLQQSSVIGDYEDSLDRPGSSMVWLGIDDPRPRILASKAREHGIDTTETVGWINFPLSDDILLSTRMHLDREQVKELISNLQKWLDTGEF